MRKEGYDGRIQAGKKAAPGTGEADHRSDGVPYGTLDQRVRPVRCGDGRGDHTPVLFL